MLVNRSVWFCEECTRDKRIENLNNCEPLSRPNPSHLYNSRAHRCSKLFPAEDDTIVRLLVCHLLTPENNRSWHWLR